MTSRSQQIRACLYKYKIQTRRFKWSLLGLVVIPIITAFILWLKIDFHSYHYTENLLFATVLIVICYGTYVRVTIGDIVNERKEKLKEAMLMKGLSPVNYNLGVLLVAVLKSAVMAIPYMIVFIEILPILKLIEFYLAFLLTGLAYASFTLAMSAFFANPKIAIQVASIICTIQLFGLGEFRQLRLLEFLFGLFPAIPLTWIMNCFMMPPDYETISSFHFLAGFSSSTGFSMLVIGIIMHYLLFSYLDAVISHEGEVKKRFYFFLCCRKKKHSNPESHKRDYEFEDLTKQRPASSFSSCQLNDDDFDSSSAFYHEDIKGIKQERKSLRVTDLTKLFNGIAVVDSISFDLYEKEIFCLLGQNGAGKTTLISMLTGMLQKDSGVIDYGGRDLTDDFDAIRLNVGFCAQKDSFFHYLTVREHIRFFAMLRGFEDPKLSSDVEEILHKCHLIAEAEKLAPNLSSGNKRKLSLGIALIGDPKVLFLDEPTSGMDPDARRSIWNVLKSLRGAGKTIVVTTQYLDEADELSDRIGVLTRGKLLCLGSSEFIKRKFGVGYHLILTKKECSASENGKSDWSGNLKRTVLKHIFSATQIEDTAVNVLKFLLPFTEQHKFIALFQEIESNPTVSLNLEMNSLEDAFINIRLEEEKILEQDSEKNEKCPLTFSSQGFCNQEEAPTQSRYTFWDQFNAMFLRKLFQTIRSKENVFFYLSPLLFVAFISFAMYFRGPESAMGYERQREDEYRLFMLLFYTLIGFSVSCSIYMYLIVKEKEENMKFILTIMGCRTLPYWLGTFAVDSVISLFVSAGVILFVPLSHIQALNQHVLSLYTIVYSFLLNITAMTYFWSLAYTSAVNSQQYFGVFASVILFMLPYCSGWILKVTVLRYVSYLLSPMGIFADTIFCLENRSYDPPIWNDACSQPWGSVIFMLCMTGIYLSITIYLDGKGYDLVINLHQTKKKHFVESRMDLQVIADAQAVSAERERVCDPNNQDMIKAINISKTYSNGFPAVKNLSFGVQQKEIFGLLGPTGAGKSTILNIISGLTTCTEGSVELDSEKVSSNFQQNFKPIGVCPQFNPLWGNITVKEHLTIFGKLKGLQGVILDQNINYFLKALSLLDHASKKADHLSGGNKRKLSVVLALLGAPKIQFLDEPSTGLDPVAQKFLWKILTGDLNRREPSIILTTHSISEAEKLCSRLGIMINGEFVCIGTVEDLKAKFGQGYQITLTKTHLAQPSMLHLAKQISSDAVKVLDAGSINETFQVPKENFLFSKTFMFLESLKEETQIKDFSINTTNLEQVFLRFSQSQLHNDEQRGALELPIDLQVH